MYSLSTFRLYIYFFFVSFIEYTNSLSIFSYDYYLLSIRHVKGICVERICKYKPNIEWTIHGLWPNKNNNNHPAYCSTNKVDFFAFPYELIKSIDINWKNLYHETVTSFLENQWLKHGSCINFSKYGVKNGKEQLFFFNKVLDLFSKYNPNKFFINNDEYVDSIKLIQMILTKCGNDFFFSFSNITIIFLRIVTIICFFSLLLESIDNNTINDI